LIYMNNIMRHMRRGFGQVVVARAARTRREHRRDNGKCLKVCAAHCVCGKAAGGSSRVCHEATTNPAPLFSLSPR